MSHIHTVHYVDGQLVLSIDGEVPRQRLASYPGVNPEIADAKKTRVRGSTAG
jgi:hypothetical protein